MLKIQGFLVILHSIIHFEFKERKLALLDQQQ